MLNEFFGGTFACGRLTVTNFVGRGPSDPTSLTLFGEVSGRRSWWWTA